MLSVQRWLASESLQSERRVTLSPQSQALSPVKNQAAVGGAYTQEDHTRQREVEGRRAPAAGARHVARRPRGASRV